MREKLPAKVYVTCPFPDCSSHSQGPKTGHIVQRGFYFRKHDSKQVRRYKCGCCLRSFSAARLHPTYKQKKPDLNFKVYQLLASGNTQRGIARYLNINLKTVVRKLIFMSEQCEADRLRDLSAIAESAPIEALQFDELETFEHTKCLPLSVPLAVVPGTRKNSWISSGENACKGITR